MNEPHAMGCDELADVAAELALGVLTGRERAEALAHLAQCPACRENVRQLAVTGEELLELLPLSEPPPGFETRVMDRLGFTTAGSVPGADSAPVADSVPGAASAPVPGLASVPVSDSDDASTAGRPRRGHGIRQLNRSRRLLTVAAAVAAIAVAAVGGWGLRAATTSPAKSPLSSAELLSATHQRAGTIYLYNGSPGWLYMYVDLSSRTGTVICQVISRDWQITTVGSFHLDNGYGAWGSPEPDTTAPPAAVRLVTPGGTVIATATISQH